MKDEKIRKAAIRVCKSYGTSYPFRCPVCKRTAVAKKYVAGILTVECDGCKKTMGWFL